MYYLLTQMQIIVLLLLLETSKHFVSVLNKIINEKLIDLNRYDKRLLNYVNKPYLSVITVVLTLLAFLLRRSVPQRKKLPAQDWIWQKYLK